MERSTPMALYEEIASRLEGLIADGTFGPGDRLPSVRALSREWGVSITTVQEAYRRLENAGVLEARPQSGHYVRPRPLVRVASSPAEKPTCPEPRTVTTRELAWNIFREGAQPGLVKLGAAIPSPDLLPVTKLNRALAVATRRAGSRAIGYQPPDGVPELRAELARRAVEAGCAARPDDFVVTNGCMEAVTLALRVVCRPGDTVALESPVYFGHLQALETLGLRVLEIPTHEREGLSIEALRFALDHHSVQAVIASPNFSNPLGSLMPGERKRELVALLGERDIPLIEDDLYGELGFEGPRPRAAASYDADGRVVLWCSSVSKTLAPGWRVGWVASARWKSEIERLRMVFDITSPTPPQLALLDFFQTGGYDYHLRRMRKHLACRMRRLVRVVREAFPRPTRIVEPAGGMVTWVVLPPGLDAVKLYRAALCQGITIAPGSLFSAAGQYRNCIRLNAAFATEENEPALRTLGRLAGEQTAARPAADDGVA
ncbi:MAG: PLP-dependent aminotransferase family protein [Candidatus Sumerlaeia bacterium]|nr:PLP-dependent aminotransferase family protein [Candidatus Sumerlaeia bacterium]